MRPAVHSSYRFIKISRQQREVYISIFQIFSWTNKENALIQWKILFVRYRRFQIASNAMVMVWLATLNASNIFDKLTIRSSLFLICQVSVFAFRPLISIFVTRLKWLHNTNLNTTKIIISELLSLICSPSFHFSI